MADSTLKGAIAEAAITAAAVELGIVVLRPLVEGRRYTGCRSTWWQAAGRSI